MLKMIKDDVTEAFFCILARSRLLCLLLFVCCHFFQLNDVLFFLQAYLGYNHRHSPYKFEKKNYPIYMYCIKVRL